MDNCKKCGASEWGQMDNRNRRGERYTTRYCRPCRRAYQNRPDIAAARRPTRSAIQARRKARKLDQTPPDADMALIREFYLEAERLSNETGVPHHVDHIHPLSKGGLHHQDNLQVLTAEENLKKSDKLQWQE